MVVVAQLVRALDCGSRGRGFKSHHPPINRNPINKNSVNWVSSFIDSMHTTSEFGSSKILGSHIIRVGNNSIPFFSIPGAYNQGKYNYYRNV